MESFFRVTSVETCPCFSESLGKVVGAPLSLILPVAKAVTGSRKEHVLLEWRRGDNTTIRLFRCSHVFLQNRRLLPPVSVAGWAAAVGVEASVGILGAWRSLHCHKYFLWNPSTHASSLKKTKKKAQTWPEPEPG